MNRLYLDNKPYSVPGSWNELPERLLLKIIGYSRSTLIPEVFHVRALLALVTYGKSWWRKLYLRYVLSTLPAEERYDLLRLNDFLLEKTGGLTKNPFSHIVIGKNVKVYGHSCLINTITFAEFYECEPWVSVWLESKDMKALRQIACVLYRPKNAGGGRCEQSDEYTAGHLPLWDGVAEEILLAIWMQYECAREHYISSFPRIFKKSSTNETEKAEPGNASAAWYKLIRDLADKDLDKQTKLLDLPLGTILYETDLRLVEQREQKIKNHGRRH